MSSNVDVSRRARWRVLVAEDDSSVAALHRELVDSLPSFEVVDVVSKGDAVAEACSRLEPDLVVLDLSMPGAGGIEVLRDLRVRAVPVEVVIVTASREAATVREAMHLGVIDYLVKPFAPERLREALLAFAGRHNTFRRSQLAQDDIDIIQATGGSRMRRLPKGLKRSTLRAVIAALAVDPTARTAEEIAAEVGVARVTARRYLEYLEVIGSAEVLRERSGPGRPRNRYRQAPAEDAAVGVTRDGFHSEKVPRQQKL